MYLLKNTADYFCPTRDSVFEMEYMKYIELQLERGHNKYEGLADMYNLGYIFLSRNTLARIKVYSRYMFLSQLYANNTKRDSIEIRLVSDTDITNACKSFFPTLHDEFTIRWAVIHPDKCLLKNILRL